MIAWGAVPAVAVSGSSSSLSSRLCGAQKAAELLSEERGWLLCESTDGRGAGCGTLQAGA